MKGKHELLKALARCRIMKETSVVEDFKLNESVVVKLLSEKLVATETHQNNKYYVLTSKGEQYVKQELPEVSQVYRGFVLEQDLSLMEFYSKLNQQERDTWETKDDFIVQYQLSGTVDGAYRNANGEMVAVKAVSSKASFSAVERVENFLKQANISHVQYLVYKAV